MEPLKPVLALGCGLLLASACASAQWRYRDYDDRPDRHDRAGNGIVDRALRDLDSTRSQGYVDHHERSRFEHARRDLLAFQDRWYRGRFDKGHLDSAMENLDHLARSRQVNPYDRRTLERDFWALRDFRAQRGSYRGWGSGWR